MDSHASLSISPPAVRIEKVNKVFGTLEVLQGIQLQISESEFISVIGPSGCGKTTLLRILRGLEDATEGKVEIEGHPVSVARASQEIGVAFQQPALIPSLTAAQNVQTTLDLCSRVSELTPPKILPWKSLAPIALCLDPTGHPA